jgi:hypothetical protein
MTREKREVRRLYLPLISYQLLILLGLITLHPSTIAGLQILCVLYPAAATITYELDKKSKSESCIIVVTQPPDDKAKRLDSVGLHIASDVGHLDQAREALTKD